jgi:prepilin peptidase CpaA
MIPWWIFLFLTIELITVSIQDVRTQKISNYWSKLNLITFLILLFIAPEYYRFEWGTFFYSLVFLFVGFSLFLLKIMGGGDSKFLSTFYLLVPVALQPDALKYLLISTMIIGLFFLITNFAKNYQKIIEHTRKGEIHLIKQYFGSKFSFAPVILLSWVWLGFEKTIW